MRSKRCSAAVVRRISGIRYWSLVLTAGLALLATGCTWGLVTDSQTGQAVPGAQIAFRDSEGNSAATSTNENGLYAFDLRNGPIPAKGTVTYDVVAPGYEPLTVQRVVRYDDNPAGTWEVQSFALVPVAAQETDCAGLYLVI